MPIIIVYCNMKAIKHCGKIIRCYKTYAIITVNENKLIIALIYSTIVYPSHDMM